MSEQVIISVDGQADVVISQELDTVIIAEVGVQGPPGPAGSAEITATNDGSVWVQDSGYTEMIDSELVFVPQWRRIS